MTGIAIDGVMASYRDPCDTRPVWSKSKERNRGASKGKSLKKRKEERRDWKRETHVGLTVCMCGACKRERPFEFQGSIQPASV